MPAGHMCSPLASQPGQPLLADAFLNPWNVDFTAGQWPDGLTCSRASIAAVCRPNGMIEMLPPNTQRFDFDPVRQQPRGLYIEGARTNLALHSRDLSQSAWVKTTCTATLNHTGIDGAPAAASTLTATAGGATCLQSLTAASAAYSFSVYLKRLNGSGTVELTTNGGSTWAAVEPTATWQRFTLPAHTIANPSFGIRLGTAGDSIAVDGCQNEPGPFASSVIFTTTATATRAADICLLTTLATIGFNPTAGSLVAEFEFSSVAPGQAIAYFTNGSSSRIGFRRANAEPLMILPIVELEGSNQTDSLFLSGPGHAMQAQTIYTAALSYRADDFLSCLNGGSVMADTSGLLPNTLNRLHVGRSSTSSSEMFGWVRRLLYIPTSCSAGRVQALSLHR